MTKPAVDVVSAASDAAVVVGLTTKKQRRNFISEFGSLLHFYQHIICFEQENWANANGTRDSINLIFHTQVILVYLK